MTRWSIGYRYTSWAVRPERKHRLGAASRSLISVAIIYQAQLTPSKIELLAGWVPAQPWLGHTDASTLEAVGAYRFDDPEGEVGIETHLLRSADGQVLQAPVTYRGAPLLGAESSLVTTVQHSVLGTRWVYDACGDPVYAQALAAAILTGGSQADLEFVTDTGTERRQSATEVSGSGSPDSEVPTVGPVAYVSKGARTVVTSDHLELIVVRVIGAHDADGDAHTLVGTWPEHDAPALLASARIT